MKKDLIVLFAAFLLIFMGFDSAQQYLAAVFSTENVQALSFITLSLL
jgi:hypothetical protein